MTTFQSPTVDNGVDVEAVLSAREALTAAPEGARFQWRARCRWVNGTHSRSTVHDFTGLGAEHTHRTPFVFEATTRSCSQRRTTGRRPSRPSSRRWRAA
jgi:hypothetical protein